MTKQRPDFIIIDDPYKEPKMNPHSLLDVKHHPLTDTNGFIALNSWMGSDVDIAEKARTSYGRDGKSARQLKLQLLTKRHGEIIRIEQADGNNCILTHRDGRVRVTEVLFTQEEQEQIAKAEAEDRNLIRRLLRDAHTSPFEMVEFIFIVQVPMDCWRQWVRHRTASINEYSTRYMEAIDCFQITNPTEWRLQSTDNKQGSSGYLTEWPEDAKIHDVSNNSDNEKKTYHTQVKEHTFITYNKTANPGQVLSKLENEYHNHSRRIYQERLALGVAREQARKDLPLSTYTRAYWKCDLHNIFNFLRLRLDPHAQEEIRRYAQSMYSIVQQVCPIACEALEDYVLQARKFSRMEMAVLKDMLEIVENHFQSYGQPIFDQPGEVGAFGKHPDMTKSEWKDFVAKLS